MKLPRLVLASTILACCAAQFASADILVFTNKAAFLSAAAAVQTQGFDSLPAGTIISDEGSVAGLTFDYDFSGVQLMVSDAFDTTSAPNFLGTDDGDLLQDGDDFTITFSPRSGIGLSIISADVLFDGDFTWSAGMGAVNLNASAPQSTLPDGSKVFFLGLIDTVGSFTSASLTTNGGGGAFLYNVDDIVSAVPEVGSLIQVACVIGISIAGIAMKKRVGSLL